jgi:hypothetical protein
MRFGLTPDSGFSISGLFVSIQALAPRLRPMHWESKEMTQFFFNCHEFCPWQYPCCCYSNSIVFHSIVDLICSLQKPVLVFTYSLLGSKLLVSTTIHHYFKIKPLLNYQNKFSSTQTSQIGSTIETRHILGSSWFFELEYFSQFSCYLWLYHSFYNVQSVGATSYRWENHCKRS